MPRLRWKTPPLPWNTLMKFVLMQSDGARDLTMGRFRFESEFCSTGEPLLGRGYGGFVRGISLCKHL